MDVLGIDVSPKSIQIARSVAKENPYTEGFGVLRYKVANFLTAKFGQNQWDSVVFLGALHHFPNVDTVLQKTAKLLKPEGNLILCEPVTANFTRAAAQQAALFRAICPTWQPYEEKLSALCDAEAWEKYVTSIFLEYTYKDAGGQNVQSTMDNVTNSEELMVSTVKKYFHIKKYVKADAFIDKLVGGLRGPDRHTLARFLKLMDDYSIANGLLPHTNVRIHAVRKSIEVEKLGGAPANGY